MDNSIAQDNPETSGSRYHPYYSYAGNDIQNNPQKTKKTETGSRYRPYYSFSRNGNGLSGDRTDDVKETPVKKNAESAVVPEGSAREEEMKNRAERKDETEERKREEERRNEEERKREEERKHEEERKREEERRSEEEKRSKKNDGKSARFYKYGFFACLIVLLAIAGLFFYSFEEADSGPKIAVINIYGEMVTGELPYGSGYAGSDTVCRLIRQAVDDDCVAIVLRINSGGGSGSAAEEINMEIRRAQAAGIPVVASIGDTGASAAYWVASQCDYVYVTKSTMTGSIGSVGIHTDYSESLESEGIKIEIFKSGAFKDMFYPYRELTDEERLYWQKFIDSGARRFIEDVAAGRHMSIREVEKLADGRAYSGDDAVYLKLADDFGNFYTAVGKAKELAGVSSVTLVYMDYEDYSVISRLLGFGSENAENTSSFRTMAENIAKSGKTGTEIRYSLN